jgi:hypothetical protein
MEMNMEEVDLEKIAEFINSDNEENIDKNEIESTLDYIDNQLQEVKKETKEITTPEEVEKQQHTIDELTNIMLNQFNKVNKNTDEIYDLFYKPLALRQDRSDASKMALLDSQRIKVEMMAQIANIISAQAKLEQAKAKQTPSGNVFINAQNGADVGISLAGLKEDL